MRSSLLSLLSLTGLLVSGCGGKNDSGETGDSVDTQPVYDEGCITVDGDGGYAHLVDAITVADEGSTIALCEGTFAEPTEVTKGVIITGAGAGTILQGDGTNPALNVTASNVTVSDMTIQGSYTGLGISGADVTVSNVTFEATGGWGIAANAAAGLTVSGCTFDQNVGGGIDVEGGEALITGNTFTLPTGFAIQLGSAAVGTISSNQIDGVIAEKNNYKDGYGVYVLGGAFATLDGNTIAGATSISVKVKDGMLDASNELWSESAFGLYVDGGSADLDSSTLDGQTVAGVFAVGPAMSVTNTTITTEPAESCEVLYSGWGPLAANGDYGCGGILLQTDVADIEDVSVSGFNNYGVFVLPYMAEVVPVTLTNVAIDDVGRIGIFLSGVTATAAGISVTNLREPELETPCTAGESSYSPYYSPSLLVDEGELNLTGATFTDNQGWGVSAYGSRVAMADVTFSGQACSAILNLASAVQVERAAFTGPSSLGTIWDYTGATFVNDSSFTANHAVYSGSQTNADFTVTTYESSPGGVDINAYQSTSLIVTNSTFSDGDGAITAYASDLEVSGNTFTGYRGYFNPFSVYTGCIMCGYDNVGTVVSSNTADDFGGSFLSATYGEVELRDNVVGTTHTYDAFYSYSTDGVLDYEAAYTSYSAVLSAYGSSGSPCDLIIDRLTIESAYSGVLSISDCAAELNDVQVGAAGVGASGQAIYGSWYSTDPLIVIDGLSVDAVSGYGVYLSSNTAGTSYVDISGLDFGTVSGIGFYASGFQDLALADSTLGDVASTGVQINGRNTGDSTASIDSVSIGTGAAYGFYGDGLAGFTVSNSDATGRTAGLYVSRSTADIQNNLFTGGTDYGMRCLTTTLAACAANDLSGNTLGEHFGCSDDCGI